MVAGFDNFVTGHQIIIKRAGISVYYIIIYRPTRGDITLYTSLRHRKLSSSIFYSNIDVEPLVKRRSHYIIKNVYTIHVINIYYFGVYMCVQ